jgi:DNA polymerase (family 10)
VIQLLDVAERDHLAGHPVGHHEHVQVGRRDDAGLDQLDRLDRLDLRDAHARAAAEAGVLVAVNSDAHQLSALEWPEIGIAQARRGWLTRKQVLNTRPWAEIEKLLQR